MSEISTNPFNTLAEARDAYSALETTHKDALSELETKRSSLVMAKEEAIALREDLTAANEMLDEANSNMNSLNDQVKHLKDANESLTDEKNQAKVKISLLEGQIRQLESEERSAEAKAAEICASVGVDPVKVTPGGEPSQQSHVEKLRSFTSPAKQIEYFRKHKQAILGES